MQQTTLMRIKSNLEKMNKPENDRQLGNVTGLTIGKPEPKNPGLEKTVGFANPIQEDL